MQAQNWDDIKNILQDILEAGFSERKERLKILPPETREEIESLLVFEEKAGRWNPLTAAQLAGDIFEEEIGAANSLVGQRVGVYEILAELGAGGMGAVYLGKRADGKFEQTVAVKMLKREFNIEKIRRYFKRESEIQARLEHPFIARLLDVGTTDDGVPFFVMEYVEGLLVDKFCEKNNLTVTARLKIFNKICQAVAHAHRNLIIHRDLKPSNILVNRQGEPKLLDFGISKLLDSEESTDKTAATLFGAMTPEYASPEQISGETVSTAADIYSLGVVLCKMLTGKLPYDFTGKKNGEILRTITDDEPIPPSAISNAEPEISNSENSKSEIRNSKLLKGDLDIIILKSLRKEPAQRYETVEQFSADVWRYIDGLPVSARRATFSYRAARFIKRRKFFVVAALLIFLSLIGGVAAAIWQANVAHAQASLADESRRQSEIETEKAQAEQAKSEKITAFMSKIIGYANPEWYAEGAKFGRNARVIDALDDLGDQIDAEFAGQADVQAELHHKFAEVYLFMGKSPADSTYHAALGSDEAARLEDFRRKRKLHILRALELRRQFYGEWHELVAKDLYYSYNFLGETEAERAGILMRAISMMRDTNPNNLNMPYMFEAYSEILLNPKIGAARRAAYRNAALPATGENEYQIAERFIRESLPVFRFHYKQDNPAIFEAECKLSYSLAKQKKMTDFDEHYSICKQYAEKSAYEKSPEIMSYYIDLIEKTLAEKDWVVN